MFSPSSLKKRPALSGYDGSGPVTSASPTTGRNPEREYEMGKVVDLEGARKSLRPPPEPPYYLGDNPKIWSKTGRLKPRSWWRAWLMAQAPLFAETVRGILSEPKGPRAANDN